MQRRKLLFGFGTVVASGSTILGTVSFTSVETERQINVDIAGDSSAFVVLEELGSSKYHVGGRSTENGKQVQFSFPGVGERLNDPDFGLGTDSVYEFDRDSGESVKSNPTEGLLRIKNQGTQSVETYSEHQTDSEIGIELYDVNNPEKRALRDNPVLLDVGEYVDVGFRIRTFGADIDVFNETLTIVAEVTP